MDFAVFSGNAVAGPAGKAFYATDFDRDPGVVLRLVHLLYISVFLGANASYIFVSVNVCVVFSIVWLVYRAKNAKSCMDK